MNSWKSALAVLAIFILGTIFGLVISFWITPRVGVQASPAQQVLNQRFSQRLVRNLSLSQEQEKAVSGIIADARSQLLDIRTETRPRVREVIVNARARIRAQLNPEQQAQFDRILQSKRMLLNRLLSRQ